MNHHTSPAVLTGFDDIRFDMLIQGREDVYPDWEFSANIITRPIPGSNRAIVQNMGTAPATLTLRIDLQDRAAYRALLARLGTMGSLTLLADFTSAVGERFHQLGRDYERLDHVLLANLSSVDFLIGGAVECNATFQRAMNPITGMAVP